MNEATYVKSGHSPGKPTHLSVLLSLKLVKFVVPHVLFTHIEKSDGNLSLAGSKGESVVVAQIIGLQGSGYSTEMMNFKSVLSETLTVGVTKLACICTLYIFASKQLLVAILIN